jgi:hypothetical protein
MRSLGRRSKDNPGLGGKKGEEFEGDYMDGMGIHLVGTMGSSFFFLFALFWLGFARFGGRKGHDLACAWVA